MNSHTASVARSTGIQLRPLLVLAFIVAMFAAMRSTAQVLQAGVSVNLPVVSNATAVPDADKEDALIVAVTETGDTYLGPDPITPDALAAKVKHAISFNPRKGFYIKADARAPYADIERVLSAVRRAGVRTPMLLTTNGVAVKPGTLVLPQGLRIFVGPELRPESQLTLVQVLSSGEQSPTLMVNHERVSWTDLPSVLGRLVPAQSANVVQIMADGPLPFSDGRSGDRHQPFNGSYGRADHPETRAAIEAVIRFYRCSLSNRIDLYPIG